MEDEEEQKPKSEEGENAETTENTEAQVEEEPVEEVKVEEETPAEEPVEEVKVEEEPPAEEPVEEVKVEDEKPPEEPVTEEQKESANQPEEEKSVLSHRNSKNTSKTVTMDQPEESGERRAKTANATVDRYASAMDQKAFPSKFLSPRSPFIHDPPQPEERRERVESPRTPKEYIINLRENLADFQESHGLPRTRDYSFMSLGLALAQETLRAVYSVFLMFAELFPILAIVSLILRFALDKLIEILETPEPVTKIKKAVIFALEMIVILIPLWILVGTIILPLMSLIFSIFKRVFRLKGGKKRCAVKPKPKPKPKPPIETCGFF